MQSCIDGIAVSPAMLSRDDLVERRADVEVGALRLLRMRLREEHRARPEVVAADLRRLERLGHAHVGVADDRQVLRATARAAASAPSGIELEVAADLGRRPQILRRAPGVAIPPRRAPTRCRRGASCRRPPTRRRPSRASGTPAPSRRGTEARPRRPCPRRNVRRGIAFPVRICIGVSSGFELALRVIGVRRPRLLRCPHAERAGCSRRP